MIEELTTLDDSRLDVFMRLTEIQLRNKLEPEKGIFIAESEKVVTRALDAGYEPITALFPHHKIASHQRVIERLQNVNTSCVIFTAPDELIETLTGYELTRGILVAFKRKPLPAVSKLIHSARVVAVLEDITNHTNIGAIFRSAAALGVDAILLNQGCCDPLYRRAIRVSMGTVFQVPWTRFDSFDAAESLSWPKQALATLHDHDFAVCALALKEQSIPLNDPSLDALDKVALLFGTEGDGLSDGTLELCDYSLVIPMAHGVDSLNVAAASAVTFWEFCSRNKTLNE